MRSRTLPVVLGVACLAAAGVLAVGQERLAEPTPTPTPTAAASPAPTPTLPAEEPTPPEPTELESEAAPPPPADRADVVADLQALLADPELTSGGATSLVVLDEWGRAVVEVEPELGLLPASTMKLVTAAAVLELYGADGRLETEVLLDGELTPGGTLLGDVVVRGGGDPALTTEAYRWWVYPRRPASDLADVVEVLRAAGVERIAGDVVADPANWADQRTPAGWRDAYLSDFDGRYITGLTVNAGLDVRLRYARSQWPTLDDAQIDDGLVIDLARDPVVEAAQSVHEEIRRAGIPIDGTWRVDLASLDAVPVGVVRSPPVDDLVAFMVKESDNHLADTLFRAVGADLAGRSTWDLAAKSVKVLLGDLKVDFTGAVFADGSGLSREDRLTARVLAQLDLAMTNTEVGDAWASFQAVAGEDGTLRGRLRGTIAQGRFRGKTGTLNDVRSLAGAVEGPDGSRYHLALVGNGGEVWRLNPLADAIVLRLTRSLWCDLPTTPEGMVEACAALAAADVTGPSAPGAPSPPEASEQSGAGDA